MDIDAKRIARTGQLIIVLVFGGVAIWLATAPLHGAVVVPGSVMVDANRKTIQHSEGGIVKTILVRDGDRVSLGQPLVVLQDSQVSAAYSVLRNALDAEQARQSRLRAEASTAADVAFPAELIGRRDNPDVAEIMVREQMLFRTRRSALGEQVKLIEEQIGQAGRQAEALKRQMEAEIRARKFSEEELATYASLHEKQFIATTRLLEQKRVVAEYQSRSEERQADIAGALKARDELRLRIAGLRSDYSRVAAEDLKDSTVRVVELYERMRSSEDALRRQTIAAPVSGHILGLRVHTAGAAIGPREALMDIVPDSGPLVIHGRAGVDSIKELYVGQEAEIRFTALPYRTTPLVPGRLNYIAADAMVDELGMPYFQVHVEPDAAAMRRAGLPPLQPGMAAELYIRTQARTALEYLLRPVVDSLLRAFRER